MMLWLALLPALCAAVPVDYDAVIAEAHAAAAKNRAELLHTWTWAPGGGPSAHQQQCPDGPSDICHAKKCKHCGCHGGAHAVRCPPPTPPPPTPQVYAGCPNQVQCGAIDTSIATLFSNTNATSVAGVNAWLEANFANTSSDWWRTTLNGPSLNMTGFSGCPLENSYSVAVFTMFNSRSRWVKAGKGAALSAGAEKGMKAFFLKYVEDCARFSPSEDRQYPLFLKSSENIDTVRHTGCAFGSATLALFPDTANHTLPDKSTVYETAQIWEDFTWQWLKAKALHGLFDELHSSGYWGRTWPCVWNLHTLSEPGSRVHQRAKMFIDLAMLEAELASINGVCAGQKSRDKKGQTCAMLRNSSSGQFNASERCAPGKMGSNPAITHHMYTALTPQLYGDDMAGPCQLYAATVVTQQVGDYQMSNVSVLIHKLGAAPETNGVYTMRNRMMGQLQGCSDAKTASRSRCEETFRPYPCAGGCPTQALPGQGFNMLLKKPKQIHVVSHTKDWALAGVEFSPNDVFVANTQQRGTGLVFANDDHSTVTLPHLTGEKWGTVDRDLMMVQRCGSCNYGGPPVFQIFNASSVWQGNGDWWFMSASAAGKAMGWAAMRAAYGGATFENSSASGAARVSGNIGLNDVWSPLLLLAGGASEYGTVENFTSQVEAAPFTAVARSRVSFGWRGRNYGFTPGPRTWKGKWSLPTIGGKPIDIDPPFMYSSPHLNAGLQSDVVVASYGKYQLKYDFSDDTITRTDLLADDDGDGRESRTLQSWGQLASLIALLPTSASKAASFVLGSGFTMAGYNGTNGTVITIPEGCAVSITSVGRTVLDAGSKGSLFIVKGSLTLEGLTLKNGVARGTPGGNGGVFNTYGSAAFTRCSFINNSAPDGDGGVAHVHSNASATFTGCSFAQNSAGAGGGAVDVYLGSARFVNCSFEVDSRGTALKHNGIYDGGKISFGCPAGTTGVDVLLKGNATNRCCDRNTSQLPPAQKIASCH